MIPVAQRSPDVERWQEAGRPALILGKWWELTPGRLEAERPTVSVRCRELLALSYDRELPQEGLKE